MEIIIKNEKLVKRYEELAEEARRAAEAELDPNIGLTLDRETYKQRAFEVLCEQGQINQH
jgi:hypothetical protein